MPVWRAPTIADVGVIEGDEGIEEEFSPWESREYPCQRDEVVAGEGDKKSFELRVLSFELTVLPPKIPIFADKTSDFRVTFDDAVPLFA